MMVMVWYAGTWHFNAQLDIKQVMSVTFFPANLLAWYWKNKPNKIKSNSKRKVNDKLVH